MTIAYKQISYLLLTCLVIVCARSGGHGGLHGHGVGHFTGHPVSAHYAHYSYHPPDYVRFMCRHCANTVLYPVYHSSPPTYVYKFRASSNRYALLLAGLSLYNLGRCCGHQNAKVNVYAARSDEQCSMQIIDQKHDFEEVVFPCFMMSSFMERKNQSHVDSLTVALPNRTAAVETISVDIETANIDVRPYLSSNETDLTVSYDQQCVIWHNLTINKEKHNVPCELLERYANTLKSTGVPMYIWLPTMICIVLTLYVLCYCFCRKQKDKKEVIPLNQGEVYRYCSNNY